MSKLIAAIQDIIGIFQNYSQKDCSHIKLNKDELNLLIQNEFSDVIKNPKDPNTISSLIQILDEDNDGEVDFNEFCDLLCKVLKAYYKVVYEKEGTCQQQDQPTKDRETTSDTAPKVTDEQPKFYQKPLFPKSEKTPSIYLDQKGQLQLGIIIPKLKKLKSLHKLTSKKLTRLKPMIPLKSQQLKLKKHLIHQQETNMAKTKHLNQTPQDQDPMITTRAMTKNLLKIQAVHNPKIMAQATIQSLNKTQPRQSLQVTVKKKSKLSKTLLKPKATTWVKIKQLHKKSKQLNPTPTVSQPHGYESGKDQIQGASSSQSINYEQDKTQSCHKDTTSSNTPNNDQSQQQDTNSSQSISSEEGKDQLDTTESQSHHYEKIEDTTSSQSQYQGKKPETMAHTVVDQLGQTEEPKKFYQKPVYLPPAQGFGLATSQPPPFTQTQEYPNPDSHQIPQVPQQPQK
ncbi:unnamed protein product, partial [Ranitomeya imitator]